MEKNITLEDNQHVTYAFQQHSWAQLTVPKTFWLDGGKMLIGFKDEPFCLKLNSHTAQVLKDPLFSQTHFICMYQGFLKSEVSLRLCSYLQTSVVGRKSRNVEHRQTLTILLVVGHY